MLNIFDRAEAQINAWQNYGAIFIRLAFGYHLMQYTYEDILFLKAGENFGPYLGKLGVPLPFLMAWVVLGTEFFGGLMMITGWKIRYAAAALAINFIVAILLVHLHTPYEKTFEALQMLAVSLFLLFNGSGACSVDAFLDRRRRDLLREEP